MREGGVMSLSLHVMRTPPAEKAWEGKIQNQCGHFVDRTKDQVTNPWINYPPIYLGDFPTIRIVSTKSSMKELVWYFTRAKKAKSGATHCFWRQQLDFCATLSLSTKRH